MAAGGIKGQTACKYSPPQSAESASTCSSLEHFPAYRHVHAQTFKSPPTPRSLVTISTPLKSTTQHRHHETYSSFGPRKF
jgi:hypothetical protein